MLTISKAKYYQRFGIFNLCLSYLISILATRILTLEDRSSLGLIVTYLSGMLPMAMFGIQNSLQKFFKILSFKKLKIIFSVHISLSLVLALGLLYFGNLNISPIFIFAGILITIFSSINILVRASCINLNINALFLCEKFLLFLKLSVLTLFGLIFLLDNEFFISKSLIFFINFYLIVSFGTLLINLYLLRKLVLIQSQKENAYLNPENRFQEEITLGNVYNYSFMTAPAHVGLFDLIPILLLTITNYGSNTLIGVFFATNAFYVMPKALFNLISNKKFSILLNSKKNEYKLFSKKLLKEIIILIAFILIGLYFLNLFSREFITLILGSKFSEYNAIVLPMFALGFIQSIKRLLLDIFRASHTKFKDSFYHEIIFFIITCIPFTTVFINQKELSFLEFLNIANLSNTLSFSYVIFILLILIKNSSLSITPITK